MHPAFTLAKYSFASKFFEAVGVTMSIKGPGDRSVLEARIVEYKPLRKIVVVDAVDQTPLLRIEGRTIYEEYGTFDVIDAESNATIGALKRLGIRSMFRDEWRVLDPTDVEIGSLFEDSAASALLRRWLSSIPQSHHLEHDGTVVANYRQRFNPFLHRIDMEIASIADTLDQRLSIAIGVALVLIEGKQQ